MVLELRQTSIPGEWCGGPRNEPADLWPPSLCEGCQNTFKEGIMQVLQQTGNTGEPQPVN